MNLQNKFFIVTGAGGGIGQELALALIGKGAKVAAVDMRKESLDKLKSAAEEKKDSVVGYVLDITDKNAVLKFSEEIKEKHGGADGLINNAGIIQPFVRVNDLSYDEIEKVMNVNFYGTVYMVKSFLPQLLEKSEGYLVNVSSMGGFLPVPGQSVYGASKAAVKLLTEGLYAELKDTNVHVSVVFPGATNTNIAENSGIKGLSQKAGAGKEQKFPMLSPAEAAKIIIDGIEKNKPLIFTGKDSKIMNFLYRLNPVFATNLIAKQMKSLLEK